LIIDPVLEEVDRDAGLIRELNLELKYAIDTHIHADHITGAGMMQRRHFPNLRTVMGEKGNEHAKGWDLKIRDGETLKMGQIELEFRFTPGHTHGDHTLIYHEERMAFTGDTLLIRGCGRTDFQQGDPEMLYDSVVEKIFTLPVDYFVYPAHDMRGRTVSTVGEEKKHNARFLMLKDKFVAYMQGLKLEYPDKIKRMVPANLYCGLGDKIPKLGNALDIDMEIISKKEKERREEYSRQPLLLPDSPRAAMLTYEFKTQMRERGSQAAVEHSKRCPCGEKCTCGERCACGDKVNCGCAASSSGQSLQNEAQMAPST